MAYINYRFIAKAKGSPTNQIQDLGFEIPDVSQATVSAALIALAERAQDDAARAAKNYPYPTSANQYDSPYAWLQQHLQYLTLTQPDGSLVSYLVSGAFLHWWEVESAAENKIFDAATRAELKRRLAHHEEPRFGGLGPEDNIYLGLVATGFKGQCVTWERSDHKISDLGAFIANLDSERAGWLKTLTDIDEIDPAFLG